LYQLESIWKIQQRF